MNALVLYCGLVLLQPPARARPLPFLFHRKSKTKNHPFFAFSLSALARGSCWVAAFLHLLPDAFKLSGASAGFWVLGGFLLLFFLESFSFSHPCEEEEHDYHSLGWVAALGLSLHNLVNGVALGSGSRIAAVGWVVFAATVAHKAPEFFSLSSILLAGKRAFRRVAPMVFFVSLMIPAGAFLSSFLLSQSGQEALGWALAFSCGTFIHLAVVDLAPEMRRHQNRMAHFGAFLLGIALMALAAVLE